VGEKSKMDNGRNKKPPLWDGVHQYMDDQTY
jgi:hypothetical protein